jgi:hypothetical protein
MVFFGSYKSIPVSLRVPYCKFHVEPMAQLFSFEFTCSTRIRTTTLSGSILQRRPIRTHRMGHISHSRGEYIPQYCRCLWSSHCIYARSPTEAHHLGNPSGVRYNLWHYCRRSGLASLKLERKKLYVSRVLRKMTYSDHCGIYRFINAIITTQNMPYDLTKNNTPPLP